MQLPKNFFLAQKCPKITWEAACYPGNGLSAAGWLQERIWVGPSLGGLGKSEWLGDLPGECRRRWPRGFVFVLWGRVELKSIFSWTVKGFISEHPILDKNKAENIGKCKGKKLQKSPCGWVHSGCPALPITYCRTGDCEKHEHKAWSIRSWCGLLYLLCTSLQPCPWLGEHARAQEKEQTPSVPPLCSADPE